MTSLTAQLEAVQRQAADRFDTTGIAHNHAPVRRDVARLRRRDAIVTTAASVGVVAAAGGIAITMAGQATDIPPVGPQPTATATDQYLWCDPADAAGHEDVANGMLPPTMLCNVPLNPFMDSGVELRADAAVALDLLASAYLEEFGRSMCLVGGYMSLSDQTIMWDRSGHTWPEPGQQLSGWGTTVQACGALTDHEERWTWTLDNAPAYGWHQPDADKPWLLVYEPEA